VADHLGVARRRVRLATQQEALQASGFAVGTVAPFGEQRGQEGGAAARTAGAARLSGCCG
jgi:hypothetical protein